MSREGTGHWRAPDRKGEGGFQYQRLLDCDVIQHVYRFIKLSPPHTAPHTSLYRVCRYLRALADVEVGLLFGFTQRSEMKDHHLVLLLLRRGLHFLRAGDTDTWALC